MARLFTVRIVTSVIPDAGNAFVGLRVYETEFAGIKFSRTDEADVIKWVRVAARHRYGKDSQVIFIHEEGND